jgi:hypothetical protein
MKLILRALLITFLIGGILAVLQFILSSFGIYVIASAFYILSILPSAFSVMVFEKLFGIDLPENQTLFLLVVAAVIYLMFAFFVYCFLSFVEGLKNLKLK